MERVSRSFLRRTSLTCPRRASGRSIPADTSAAICRTRSGSVRASYSGRSDAMLFYIIRRILMMIPTLLLTSVLVFTIMELPPGDYFESYMAELQAQGEGVDKSKIEFLKREYGFDKHPVERYFIWLTGMLQGDFGYSFEYQMPVSDLIGSRIFLTIL